MFAGESFYHQLLTKYVSVFGALFNNLTIKRFDSSNNTTQLFKVPLQYAPKDKIRARLVADPNLDRPASATVPMISFEMGSIQYAPDRKIGSLQRNVKKDPTNKNAFNYLYNPVPYDINFNLFVYVKNVEDGNKIIEQILPFFTPDYTLSVELVPEMKETRDVPIVIRNISVQDEYDGDFKDRKVLVWTINFVMHAWLFGPIKNKPMIKFVTMNQRLANQPVSSEARSLPEISNTNPIFQKNYTQPGLTANGQPTSNVELTVDYHEIAVDDTWGIVETSEKISTD